MSDQKKLQKMLEMLLLLDCRFGYTVQELADKYEISARTVYRYLDTFKASGFVLENNNNHYKIDRESSNYSKDLSELLHFSEEEAFILAKAIHKVSSDGESESREKLVKKLYSLYNFDRVAQSVIKPSDTNNIYNLMQAIKKQKQVRLVKYRSAHGGTIRDRLVEPFDFTPNYISVWCWDTGDDSNKLFKTSRIQSVELLRTNWKHKKEHRRGHVDIFRVSSNEPINLKMKLSLRAYNLIIEEFPLSEKYIRKIDDNEYLLECKSSGRGGARRFAAGLPKDVEVIKPKDLLSNGTAKNAVKKKGK